MGAGAKCDPTRIQITDISNTYEDPLAKQIRVRLRKMGITHGIP
jgi:tRNA A37 threonylcarbamoyladenosine dehydratase